MMPRTSARLLLAAALLSSGCLSPVPHTWQHRLAYGAGVPFMEWRLLPRSHHCRVHQGALAEAAARLESRSSIALAAADVWTYCPGYEPPADGTLHPHLVRGVSHGRPTYSAVHFDDATGRCAIYQMTWDGENLLDVWRLREAEASPVVLFAPSEPLEVLPIAYLGGDRILVTREFEEEQEYARSLCWDTEDLLLAIGLESGGRDVTSRCGEPQE